MDRNRSPPCPRSILDTDPNLVCIYCYSNRRARGNYQGHRYYHAPRVLRKYVEHIMQREKPVPPPKKGHVSCPDESFMSQFPSVSAYLCDVWWDDGKPREPSSLSIKMDGTYVHIGLMDHAMSRSLYCTAPSLQDALLMLEEVLKGGQASWRAWKGPKR